MIPTPDTAPQTWHVHPDETTIFDKTGIAVANTRIQGRAEPAGAAADRAALIVQSVTCVPLLLKKVAFQEIHIAALQRQRDQWQQAALAVADVCRTVVHDLGAKPDLSEVARILTAALEKIEGGEK